MLLQPGHREGGRTVHLTYTSLVEVALCGEVVDLDGEPDLAVICEDCLQLARAAGVDVSIWVAEVDVAVTLPLAA